MRDLQLEIPVRFPTHYPFRTREFLNRRITLQLSSEISFEQEENRIFAANGTHERSQKSISPKSSSDCAGTDGSRRALARRKSDAPVGYILAPLLGERHNA